MDEKDPLGILGDTKDNNDPLGILSDDVKKKVPAEDVGVSSQIVSNASKIAKRGDGLENDVFFGLSSTSKSENQKSELKSKKSFFDYTETVPNKFVKNQTQYGIQYDVNLPQRKLLGNEVDLSFKIYEASPEERNIWSPQVDQIEGTGIDYWVNAPKEKKYVGALGEKSINKNFLSSTGVNKITADYLKHLNQTDKESYTLMNTLINGAGKKFSYDDVYEYDSERNRYLIKPEFKGLEPYLQETKDGGFFLRGAKDSDEVSFLANAIEHQMLIISNDFLSRTDGGKKNIEENYDKYKIALNELDAIRNDVLADSEYADVIAEDKKLREKQKEDQRKADELYEKMYRVSPKIAGLYYGVYRPVKLSVLTTWTGFWELPQMVGIDIPEFKVKAKEGAELIKADIDPTQLKGSMFENPRTITPNLVRMGADIYTMGGGGRLLGGSKIASISTGIVNQYHNYFEPAKDEALAKGYTEAQAEKIANVNGVVGAFMTAVAESFNLNIEKSLAGGAIKREITDNTVKVLAKGGTYKDALKESWNFVKKEIPKENLEEFTNMVTDKATNMMSNESYGLELDSDFNAEEIGETMFYTTVIGGLSSIRQGVTPKKLEKEYLYDALSNESNFRDKMYSLVEKGTITRDQAQEVDEYIASVKSVVKGIPDMKLSPDNFVKLVGLLEKKRLIKERKKGAYVDEVFKQKTEEKENKENAEIDAEINKIVSEKTDDATVEIKNGQIIETNDSKNEAGLSGEKQVGKESEQTELIEEKGETATSDGGVVQKAEPVGKTLYRATSGKSRGIGGLGEHWGTRDAAIERSGVREGTEVTSSYIELKNPLVVEKDLGFKDLKTTTDGLIEQGVITTEEQSKLNTLDELRELLVQKGYDGIEYTNQLEDKGSKSYIIFNEGQKQSVGKVVKPVEEKLNILDGHHRYQAYKEIGVKEVPVEVEGEVKNVPIEQLAPTEDMATKDRGVIESIKESIEKGEAIEPIKIESEVIEESRPTDEKMEKRWDERVLSALDKADSKLDEFTKGTLGINVPLVIAKGAIKVMKGVVKTAGTLQDVVNAGMDFIRNSDWYLSMGENDRRNIDDAIEYDLNLAMSSDEKVTAEQKTNIGKTIIGAIESKVKEDTKDLSKEIKEILKDKAVISKLNKAQYIALVNEARKVDDAKKLETFKSKVESIIESQTEKNIAKQKIYTANNNRKAIKKKAKATAKKTLGSDKATLKNFAILNPSSVTNIDEYNEIAEALLSNVKGERKISNEQVDNYVNTQLKEQEKKEKERILSEYGDWKDTDGNPVFTEDMSLEEMNEILETIDDIDNEDASAVKKKELLEKQKAKKREALQKQVESEIDVLNEKIEAGDFDDAHKLQKEALDALNNINLNDLSFEDLSLVRRIVSNLIVNESFSQAGELIEIQQMQEFTNELSDLLEELGIDDFEYYINKGVDTAANHLFKVASKVISSTTAVIDKVALGEKTASVLRRLSGLQDLMSGHSKMITVIDKFMDGYKKVANKNNTNYESQIKQQMYGSVSQNYGGTDSDMQKEFERNKELIRQSAIRKAQDEIRKLQDKRKITKSQAEDYINGLESGKYTYSDIKDMFKKADFTELKVYEEIIKDANNPEEVASKLNKDELAMIDYFRNEFEKIKDDLFTVSEMFGKEVPEEVINYLPMVMSKRYNATPVPATQTINEEIVNNQFIGNTVNKSQAGSTINRNRASRLGKDKVISTDFHYDMIRKFREANYQINTLKARKFIPKILNNPNFRNLINPANADLLTDEAIKQVKAQLNLFESDDLAVAIDTMNFLNSVARSGTRMALSSPLFGRFYQFFPVVIGGMAKLGKKYAGLVWTVPANKVPDSLFDHSNMLERVKTNAGYTTNFYTDEKALLNERQKIKKYLSKGFSWTEEKLEQMTDVFMRSIQKGDASAAKRMWMAYYQKYRMKYDGIKKADFDWEKESQNPSKKASAYADQLVEKTQSTNSFSSLSQMLIKQRNGKDIIKNVLFPFSTFIFNQRARIMGDIRTIRKQSVAGNWDVVGEAVQDLGAIGLEITTFTALKIAVGQLVIAGVRELLRYGGMDEEDIEALAKYYTLEDILIRGGATLLKDYFITGIPMFDDMGTSMLNWTYKTSTGNDKDLIYQRSSQSPQNEWDSYLAGFGTYGIVGKNVMNMYNSYDRLSNGYTGWQKGGLSYKEESVPYDAELTDDQANLYMIFLVHDILRQMGVQEQSLTSVINKTRSAMERHLQKEYGDTKLVPMDLKGDVFKNKDTRPSTRLGSGGSMGMGGKMGTGGKMK